MSYLPLPTLAVDAFELLIYGIGALIVIASWISNATKKSAGKRSPEEIVLQDKLRELLTGTPGGNPGTPGIPNQASPDQGQAVDLNELVAQRRRRLQELAGQRRSPISPPQSQPLPSSPQLRPGPEATAQASGAQQTPVSSSTHQRLQQLRQKAQQEAARRDQASRQRAAQRRQQAQRPRQTRLISQPRRSSPAAAGVSAQAARPQSQPQLDMNTESHVERHVADTPTLSAKPSRASLASRLGLTSWRQAMIMKEILDSPLSVRDSQDRL